MIRECPGQGTGQNLIWEQQILIFLASLTNNSTAMDQSFNNIWSSIQIESGDGIQADYSFYQHGPLLQSGTYGGDFFLDTVVLRGWAAGTQFAAQPQVAAIIDNYTLDGEAFWMRWNGQSDIDQLVMWWDVSCKGREISRAPDGCLAVNSAPITPALRLAAPTSPRGPELLALADRMEGRGQPLVGSRFFWRVDTAAHHRADFSASVHMCSTRTFPTEYVNDENALDWLAGAGTVYSYTDGGNYDAIFPVWDWMQLPGVTSRINAKYSIGAVRRAKSETEEKKVLRGN